MANYWEIIQHRRDSENERIREAYECGYEDGYKEAMKKFEEGEENMSFRGRMHDKYYGERDYGRDGRGMHSDREYSGESMGERRSRDSMGRYR